VSQSLAVIPVGPVVNSGLVCFHLVSYICDPLDVYLAGVGSVYWLLVESLTNNNLRL